MHWYYLAAIVIAAIYSLIVVGVKLIDRDTNREIRSIYPTGRKEFERHGDL